MPANTSVWTFEQLGGKRKKLQLSDHAAPHGRPRKKPVVEPELSLRMDETYLEGDLPPVWHLFGVANEPLKDQQRFWESQSAWAVSSLDAIRLALKAERAAAIAQQGNTLALYTAKQGDTWERISRFAYNGDASRANDIRNANSAEPGSQPVAGTTYIIPK